MQISVLEKLLQLINPKTSPEEETIEEYIEEYIDDYVDENEKIEN